MKRACLPSPCSFASALGSWAVAIALASTAWGQVQITSSPNPVGSGARALGMGAAFIAVADDATAASWNPGGLPQLERPEVSLVLSNKWFTEDFSSATQDGLNGEFSETLANINYLSAVYPIKHTIAGRNLILSINYQSKYDFDRNIDVNYREISPTRSGIIAGRNYNIDYQQRGQLASVSPAFGIEVFDKLSVGMAVNIYNQDLIPDNGWTVEREIRTVSRVNGALNAGSWSTLNVKERYDDFEGMNFTLGALYKPNPRWSVGAVYNTKFTADVNYEVISRNFLTGAGFGYNKRSRPQEYTFPSSFGIGAAYRFPNDKLTLSFDVTRYNWNQYVIHDPKNVSLMMQRRSGITGQPLEVAPEIDPTYTVRLGAEYVFVNPNKPRQDYLPSIRGGLFYDPEPSGGRKETWYGLDKGNGKPEDFYGFSLGAGVLIKDRVNIDFAYTFRMGNGVRKDTFATPETSGDVTQHLFYVSTVIYF